MNPGALPPQGPYRSQGIDVADVNKQTQKTTTSMCNLLNVTTDQLKLSSILMQHQSCIFDSINITTKYDIQQH